MRYCSLAAHLLSHRSEGQFRHIKHTFILLHFWLAYLPQIHVLFPCSPTRLSWYLLTLGNVPYQQTFLKEGYGLLCGKFHIKC